MNCNDFVKRIESALDYSYFEESRDNGSLFPLRSNHGNSRAIFRSASGKH